MKVRSKSKNINLVSNVLSLGKKSGFMQIRLLYSHVLLNNYVNESHSQSDTWCSRFNRHSGHSGYSRQIGHSDHGRCNEHSRYSGYSCYIVGIVGIEGIAVSILDLV